MRDRRKTRIHDLLTARPAAIPAAASIRDAARTMVNGGFRQLPVADVCGALLGAARRVTGPHRATDPGGLRAAIGQRAIPRHHQREPRMCLERAYRYRRPLDYLHGMTVDTDWQPGARVTLVLTGQWRLTGAVLAA